MQHGRMEFHVSRAARDFYDFDQALFSSSGNVIFANFGAARNFAARMNAKRDLVNFPERTVRTSQVNAMGLIDEMLHVLLDQYRRDHAPTLMADGLRNLAAAIGSDRLEITLAHFATSFPAVRVYRGEQSVEAYLNGATEGRANREIVLEELLMLYLANANPAFHPFLELFDDAALSLETAYPEVVAQLETFLEAQVPFAASGNLSIWRVLRLPALTHPESLEAQLEYLLGTFEQLLGEFKIRTLSSLDTIREEGRYFSRRAGPGGADAGNGAGDGRIQTVGARMLEDEPEAFTLDRDWMPNLVLIAKNAFVWLDQLSKQYGREIRTLDAVPDEELATLAASGVTGLWLIGLWERSHASKEIKRRMGNADAVASAYSLYDYAIAQDLGGDPAIDQLRSRAWAHGIRMASDMVPNHVGIDGKWVIEHPEWFISLPYSPFPSYSFGSADLSTDSRVAIFLEDHYYDHSDAAVVFKRVDRWTGSESFIYHGNDGTSLPWNDTAQLNYLNPEAREAVIQTILHVARNFPIIRFDAAMTLAKKHVQRLWFPEPGSGEGIASRAEHGMSREDFDQAVPLEFWREVVDRCAVETPDTLLLAEAFWMMEGYFVRSLGMHRVYNSAFMNMLRDEKNGEYRQILKSTLEFEPEILKRFVNFMNNPDERTAVDQFGKGDKYFGVATLMSTLPGLPMLGHGQIEGFTEKYGMEYRRAYIDETIDRGLVEYHASQIFPLLKRRHVFADTANFVLYDFGNEHGTNPDVYAYSNADGLERALIVYNNAHADAHGWINHGVGGKTRACGVGDALALSNDAHTFAIWRDVASGQEFIRRSADLREHGLRLELGPYGRAVLLDWHEVHDFDGRYARVADALDGRGCASVENEVRDLRLRPVLEPWRALIALFPALHAARGAVARPAEATRKPGAMATQSEPDARLPVLGEAEARAKSFADALEAFVGRELDGAAYARGVRQELEAALRSPELGRAISSQPKLTQPQSGQPQSGQPQSGQPDSSLEPGLAVASTPSQSLVSESPEKPELEPEHSSAVIFAWICTHTLGMLEGDPALGVPTMDEYGLTRALEDQLRASSAHEPDPEAFTAADPGWDAALVRYLAARDTILRPAIKTAAFSLEPDELVRDLTTDADAHAFLGINRHEGVTYLNKDALERVLANLPALAMVVAGDEPGRSAAQVAAVGQRYLEVARAVALRAVQTGYRLEGLVEGLGGASVRES
jgi:glycosidase